MCHTCMLFMADCSLLQRLALTIPNLVDLSPTQSSDGLLYAGEYNLHQDEVGSASSPMKLVLCPMRLAGCALWYQE